MKIHDLLLDTLPDALVREVCIGLHWTAVVVEGESARRCGLAATLVDEHEHGEENVPEAGELASLSGLELARFAASDHLTLRSVGAAAINALLPPPLAREEVNASQVIAGYGKNGTVALIGHFPFISQLRPQVRHLRVLELNPAEDELPASTAPDILPQADVVAMTSTTLLNHTFDDLLVLCPPQALVLLLGPSTPLSPLLFDCGVDILSGSIITAVEPVVRAVKQGANFRQVHKSGVQLVTLYRPGLEA